MVLERGSNLGNSVFRSTSNDGAIRRDRRERFERGPSTIERQKRYSKLQLRAPHIEILCTSVELCSLRRDFHYHNGESRCIEGNFLIEPLGQEFKTTSQQEKKAWLLSLTALSLLLEDLSTYLFFSQPGSAKGHQARKFVDFNLGKDGHGIPTLADIVFFRLLASSSGLRSRC